MRDERQGGLGTVPSTCGPGGSFRPLGSTRGASGDCRTLLAWVRTLSGAPDLQAGGSIGSECHVPAGPGIVVHRKLGHRPIGGVATVVQVLVPGQATAPAAAHRSTVVWVSTQRAQRAQRPGVAAGGRSAGPRGPAPLPPPGAITACLPARQADESPLYPAPALAVAPPSTWAAQHEAAALTCPGS